MKLTLRCYSTTTGLMFRKSFSFGGFTKLMLEVFDVVHVPKVVGCLKKC